MSIQKLSIKSIIVTLLVVIGLIAIVLTTVSAKKYTEQALSQQKASIARMTGVLAKEAVIKLEEVIGQLGKELRKNKALKKAIKKHLKVPTEETMAAVKVGLNSPFEGRFFTAGMIDLKSVRLYNKKFSLVSSKTIEGENLPNVLTETIYAAAKDRKKSDRLKTLSGMWVHNGKPYMSLLIPSGGLILNGYFEIVVAPAYNIVNIEEILGVPLQITTTTGDVLAESKSWSTSKVEDSLSISYVMKNTLNKDVLTVVAREDMTEFHSQMGGIKNTVLMIFAGLIAFLLVTSIVLLTRWVFKPLSDVMTELDQISKGNLNIKFHHAGTKELVALSTSLEKNTAELKGNLDTIKTQTAEVNRVKQAIDNAFASFMMLDEHYNIVYLNESIRVMFDNFTDELSEVIPDFNVDELVSRPVSLFYKNGSRQYDRMNKFEDVFIEEVTVATRSYRTVISPVMDGESRVGTVIEWLDITDELAQAQMTKERLIEERAVAQENGRVRAGLDTVQASVMLMDATDNIIYMNEMLKALMDEMSADIRHEIPQFNPEALVGTNVETLLIGNLAGKTFSELSETEVVRTEYGERTVQLTATAVMDNEERLGTVIEWVDLTQMLADTETEKVKLQQERVVAQTNQRIKQSLDQVSGNVMILATDGQIIYLNEALQAMLASSEPVLESAIPGFDAGALVGQNIHFITDNTSLDYAVFDGLSDQYSAEVQIASNIYKIIANPVKDDTGSLAGTVLEWFDRTEEISVENDISDLVEKAQSGDLSVRMDLSNKTGFFHSLGGGMNSLVEVVSGSFDDIGRVIEALSNGDLTQKIDAEYCGQFKEIQDNINDTNSSLYDLVGKMKAAGNQIRTSSTEISSGNVTLSRHTEQQAMNLEKTKTNIDELTGMVQNNAESSKTAYQLAHDASDVAEKGGNVVDKAVYAMEDISQSSQKISDIIGMIDEIAFQTNLLALNASVEAARAGDQGRGFAVVATEVRNLAQRSAGAAKQVKEQINNSLDKVKMGTMLVNQSGETLREIVNSTKKVTAIISEIDASSQIQATGIKEASSALASIDEMTQENAALAEETAAASESSLLHAKDMEALLQFFKVSVS